ncbi:MAG: endolytic transglycosylase MltG [Clostridia bacterium]|nr:endolytic transglycosylase MltG [Clostridia bacterium]
MKKKVIMGIIFAIIAILICTAISMVVEYTRTTSSKKPVIVEIPQGASESLIAQLLEEKGVIDYKINFKLKMRNSEHRGKLNYGKYLLYEKMCIEDAIETLSKPVEHKKGAKLTIPEGYSAEMIAARCEKLGICKAESFLNELESGTFDYKFISEIPENENVKYKLQGYLFPSTYAFALDTPAHDVIEELLSEFEIQYEAVKENLPEGMTMSEAINRAALIEREAKLDEERALISGVIKNRLEIGMLLQIDASVVYAISDGLYNVERVLYKDLRVDSPYNTYKNTGLPAGPICNPGIESIIAAMKPADHKYLYYHTDTEKNDGSHIFSETFAQHNS